MMAFWKARRRKLAPFAPVPVGSLFAIRVLFMPHFSVDVVALNVVCARFFSADMAIDSVYAPFFC